MNRIVSNPKVAKLISASYPVIKKRTPLWFFEQELKRNVAENKGRDGGPMKQRERRFIWYRMKLEQKRKYFNLAEFDGFRYRQQKSLWIAELGSLLVKYGENIVKHPEILPKAYKYKADYEVVRKKFEKDYDHLIQFKGTETLYKYAAERALELKDSENPEDLLCTVPVDLRPVLERPRKPFCAFMQFASDKKVMITEFRKNEQPSYTFMKSASYLWFRLPEEERQAYRDRWAKSMAEYRIKQVEFEAILNSDQPNIITLAMKEKTAFSKSLRKKLRNTQVVPINVRNPFNFYTQDHRDTNLTDLTTIWNNLSAEEKEVYRKKTEEDIARFSQQNKAYDEFLKEVLKQLKRK